MFFNSSHLEIKYVAFLFSSNYKPLRIFERFNGEKQILTFLEEEQQILIHQLDQKEMFKSRINVEHQFCLRRAIFLKKNEDQSPLLMD